MGETQPDKIQLENIDKPTQCHFFVQRKKRYCRMTVRPGKNYCGEHDPTSQDNIRNSGSNKLDPRVPCPLDPKHTCYASKLEKHLKICNAKAVQLPPYIKKGCNSAGSPVNEKRIPLKDVPLNTLILLIEKVERFYKDVVKDTIEFYAEREVHEVVREQFANEKRGNNTKRHLRQTSCLIGIIEQEGLVRDDTCFVELGAGKGHVSYYLSQVVCRNPGASVLLVDRASHRHKQDNKLDRSQHTVARLRADISDLMLGRVDIVETAGSVVAVSKHLCGVATDLALRCITASNIVGKTAGLVMATCCHHRCTADGYVAQNFLQDLGITREYFDVLVGLVSWATCGTGFSRERKREMENEDGKTKRQKLTDDKISENSNDFTVESVNHKVISDEETETLQNNINRSDINLDDRNTAFANVKGLGLDVDKRTEIGRHAKLVLDYGRIMYLKECGFKAKLCHYVDVDVSPENVCIIAKKM